MVVGLVPIDSSQSFVRGCVGGTRRGADALPASCDYHDADGGARDDVDDSLHTRAAIVRRADDRRRDDEADGIGDAMTPSDSAAVGPDVRDAGAVDTAIVVTPRAFERGVRCWWTSRTSAASGMRWASPSRYRGVHRASHPSCDVTSVREGAR